jgi:SNF2 family DNA or RNA helicase
MEQEPSGSSSPLFVPLDNDNTQIEQYTRGSDYPPSEPPVDNTNNTEIALNGTPGDTPQPNKERSFKKKSNGSRKRKRPSGNTVDMANLAPSGEAFTNIPALPEGQTVDNRFTLTSRYKADALKNLLDGIPEEHQAVAKQDRAYLDRQMTKFTGHGACYGGEKSEGWNVKGMRTQLKNYQVTGVGWMRENEGTNAKGGILGDAMGLGKTVMMIANIVNGYDDRSADTLPTLVCVPSSIMDQWMKELDRHIDPAWLKKHKLHILPFNQKMNSEFFPRVLENAFIVVATHHDVRRSCDKVKFPAGLTSTEEREAWFAENKDDLRGILHKIKWRRFVIDEV